MFLKLFVVLAIFSGCNCELELRHGNAYGFMSMDGLYLTAQPFKFRQRVGVFVGKVLSKEFTGASNQYFDLIKFVDKTDKSQCQYWPIAQQYPLNALTAIPNANTDQPFPLKNLVEFIETSPNSKKFVIRSTDLKKCVKPQGKDQPIIYVECDVDDESQQFLSTAPFLSRGDSMWHSADFNEVQI